MCVLPRNPEQVPVLDKLKSDVGFKRGEHPVDFDDGVDSFKQRLVALYTSGVSVSSSSSTSVPVP